METIYTIYDYVSYTILYDSLDSLEEKDNGDMVKRVSALALPFVTMYSVTARQVNSIIFPVILILKKTESAYKNPEVAVIAQKSFEVAIVCIAFVSIMYSYPPGIALYIAVNITTETYKIGNYLFEGDIDRALNRTMKLVARVASKTLLIIESPALASFSLTFALGYSFYAAKAEASQQRLPEFISRVARIMIGSQSVLFFPSDCEAKKGA